MVQNQNLYELFIDELEDMLSCEHQIIKSLPKLVQLASSDDLVKALTTHLEETRNQVKRLEQVFSLLGRAAIEKTCKGTRGILQEGEEMVQGQAKGPILDATIISLAQKVEHYEIASYGTLHSFAKHLDLDKQVLRLIQENLDEEGAADKKLTKIADGGIFSSGINTVAADPSKR